MAAPGGLCGAPIGVKDYAHPKWHSQRNPQAVINIPEKYSQFSSIDSLLLLGIFLCSPIKILCHNIFQYITIPHKCWWFHFNGLSVDFPARRTCGSCASKWRRIIPANCPNATRSLSQMPDGRCHCGDKRRDVVMTKLLFGWVLFFQP